MVSSWPAAKARRVLAALERLGWQVKRQSGPNRLLKRRGWPDYEFSFHDSFERRISTAPLAPRLPNQVRWYMDAVLRPAPGRCSSGG